MGIIIIRKEKRKGEIGNGKRVTFKGMMDS